MHIKYYLKVGRVIITTGVTQTFGKEATEWIKSAAVGANWKLPQDYCTDVKIKEN